MNSISNSNLIPFSKGIVATDKDRNSDLITVYPINHFPMVDGEIIDNVEEYASNFKNSYGDSISVKINTSNSIIAKYLSRDINRKTAPDVLRGSIVQIYITSNDGMYYWEPISNNDNVQTLETVIHAYSNTKNRKEELNEDNSYFTKISTHEKMVTLIKTAKSDGEKFSYEISINTKDSTVEIKDDIGNVISLNSNDQHILLKTSADGSVSIDKKDITINCNNLHINADNDISIRAKNISESSDSKHGNYSSKWDTSSPVHEHNGNYSLSGSFTGRHGNSGGGMNLTGDFNVIGNHHVDGTVVATNDAVINNISFGKHVHGGVRGGGDKSSTPE